MNFVFYFFEQSAFAEDSAVSVKVFANNTEKYNGK